MGQIFINILVWLTVEAVTSRFAQWFTPLFSRRREKLGIPENVKDFTSSSDKIAGCVTSPSTRTGKTASVWAVLKKRWPSFTSFLSTRKGVAVGTTVSLLALFFAWLTKEAVTDASAKSDLEVFEKFYDDLDKGYHAEDDYDKALIFEALTFIGAFQDNEVTQEEFEEARTLVDADILRYKIIANNPSKYLGKIPGISIGYAPCVPIEDGFENVRVLSENTVSKLVGLLSKANTIPEINLAVCAILYETVKSMSEMISAIEMPKVYDVSSVFDRGVSLPK